MSVIRIETGTDAWRDLVAAVKQAEREHRDVSVSVEQNVLLQDMTAVKVGESVWSAHRHAAYADQESYRLQLTTPTKAAATLPSTFVYEVRTGGGFRAECRTCGWESPEYTRDSQADRAAAKHAHPVTA